MHTLGSGDRTHSNSGPVIHTLGSGDRTHSNPGPVIHKLGSGDRTHSNPGPVIHTLGSGDRTHSNPGPVIHTLGSGDRTHSNPGPVIYTLGSGDRKRACHTHILEWGHRHTVSRVTSSGGGEYSHGNLYVYVPHFMFPFWGLSQYFRPPFLTESILHVPI